MSTTPIELPPGAWDFCVSSLREVSRTFAIPISMLRDRLEVAVTCGYLLCRIVDTVEDEAGLDASDKDRLYGVFLGVIEGRATAAHFADEFTRVMGADREEADHRLARRLPEVMAVVDVMPPELRSVVLRWVGEMARGMAIYTHRGAGADGMVALTTLDDLERYCYFVAGTVGQMLTGLFLQELPDLSKERARGLRADAERFGLGLQLTNILKDITDDAQRGWSFIPRVVCEDQDLEVGELLDAERRALAHEALAPVFQRAAISLDSALAYSLCIPPEAKDIRLFCLLPLWMARATLVHARGNDAQFEPGSPVKIDRAEVGRIVAECQALCGDDDALRAAYDRLGNIETGTKATASTAAPTWRATGAHA